MRFQGGYRWLSSIAVAIGTSAFFFLLLELWFKVPLLKGPLEAALRHALAARSTRPAMDNLDSLLQGFGVALTAYHVLLMIVGVLLGILVGVLPGLGAPNGVSLLLPLTFSMDPVAAIILLTSMYWGALFGGSTTSILFNIPGEPSSVATTFDGYPMARQGRAAHALTLAFLSAAFGALVGVLADHVAVDVGRAIRVALRLAGILRRLFPRVRELRRPRRCAAAEDDRIDGARARVRVGRHGHDFGQPAAYVRARHAGLRHQLPDRRDRPLRHRRVAA